MLTAFCVRTRHTGIRNVFIVWNSDSLFVSLLEPRQKILAGVERGCRGIGLEQEVAVVTYRWRRLSSRSGEVEIRILIEQKCWLFMMNSHKLLSGGFAKCRNMEISWRRDEQGSPIHCHMSTLHQPLNTLFPLSCKHISHSSMEHGNRQKFILSKNFHNSKHKSR